MKVEIFSRQVNLKMMYDSKYVAKDLTKIVNECLEKHPDAIVEWNTNSESYGAISGNAFMGAEETSGAYGLITVVVKYKD